MTRRAWVVAGLVCLLLSGAAPKAAGHAVGPQFVSVFDRVTPATGVVTVRVRTVGGHPRIEVLVRRGHRLEVDGPHGEPFLQIGPNDALVNTRSPARSLLDRAQPAQPPPPRDGAPRFVRTASVPRVAWFDPRIEFPGTDPPQAVVRAGRRATVHEWRVPTRLDGEPGTIEGRVDYVPPSPDYEVVVLGVVALGALAWGTLRSRTRLAQACTGLAAFVIVFEAARVVTESRTLRFTAALWLLPGLVAVAALLPWLWRGRHAAAVAGACLGGVGAGLAIGRLVVSGGTGIASWIGATAGIGTMLACAWLAAGGPRERTGETREAQ